MVCAYCLGVFSINDGSVGWTGGFFFLHIGRDLSFLLTNTDHISFRFAEGTDSVFWKFGIQYLYNNTIANQTTQMAT